MASGAFALAQRSAGSITRGQPDQSLETSARAAVDDAVAGRWRPLIGQTFSLERAEDAHAAIEERATVGKTLLLVK
jgi:NADPH2:quinone reductase